MTREEYKNKFKEIVDWADKETEKVNKKVEIIGLDGNKEAYQPIHTEYKNKINELKNDYK